MNNSLKDRLVRHMEDGHYEPQSKSELARALNVDSRQKQDFRAIVDQLEEEGRLVRQKGRYALKRERRNLVHGDPHPALRQDSFLPKRGIPPRRTWGGIWRPFRSWNLNPTVWVLPWTGTGWPCAWNARRPGAGGISAGTAFLPRMPA
ncbi:MAG: hypothetical protein ACLT8E_08050 [Akkermansia sp.]